MVKKSFLRARLVADLLVLQGFLLAKRHGGAHWRVEQAARAFSPRRACFPNQSGS